MKYKLIFYIFIFLILFSGELYINMAEVNTLNLAVWQTGKYVQLRWDFSHNKEFGGYNIYRRQSKDNEWEKLNSSNYVFSRFVDYSPPENNTIYYKVAELDTKKQEKIFATIEFQHKNASPLYNDSAFDKNDIISSEQLTNYSSMTLQQIQDFLTLQGSVLKDYTSGGKSAAEYIYEACQIYKINPKVVLTTLQKEMGLITSTDAKQWRFNLAMGWEPSNRFNSHNFISQINRGTNQFRRYLKNLGKYNWSVGKLNQVEDGIITPVNIATAGLYIYTPAIGKKINGICGNYLFWYIWNNVFGFNNQVDYVEKYENTLHEKTLIDKPELDSSYEEEPKDNSLETESKISEIIEQQSELEEYLSQDSIKQEDIIENESDKADEKISKKEIDSSSVQDSSDLAENTEDIPILSSGWKFQHWGGDSSENTKQINNMSLTNNPIDAGNKTASNKVTSNQQEQTVSQSKPEISSAKTASEGYIVGIGDVLEISLWQKDEEEVSTETVQDNGMITYSLIGDIMVEGLKLSEIDEKITKGLHEYLKDYEISVVVKEYRSKTVDVLGEVQAHPGREQSTGPGKYPLKGPTYLWDMIVSAGGFKQQADMKNIHVIRKGEVITVDLDETLKTGDRSNDILLEKDDLIYIPPKKAEKLDYVFVIGDVKNPGTIRYAEKLRISEAILMAGGLVDKVDKAQIEIIREDGEDLRFDFDYSSIDRKNEITLQLNDILHVKKAEVPQVGIFGGIQVLGTRKTGPGFYPLEEGIHLLKFIISAGGFTDNAQRSAITVTRKKEYKTKDIEDKILSDSLDGENIVIKLDLNKFLSEQDESQDIVLKPDDVIFIPTVEIGTHEVFVLGAVSNPGILSVKEGVTILEAISNVGGVTSNANLRNVKVVNKDTGSQKEVDLHAIIKKGELSGNITLEPNDVIYVPSKSSSVLTDLMSEAMPLLQLGAFLKLLSK